MKKTEQILALAGCMGLSLFSLLLLVQIDPIRENLTGLGWVHGRILLMGLYTALACLLNGWLGFCSFKESHQNRNAIFCLIVWVGLFLGAMLPWQERAQSLHLDLHSLLCTIALCGYALLWMAVLARPWSAKQEKQTALAILAAMLISLVLFALCGSISLLSELFFVLANPWILYAFLFLPHPKSYTRSAKPQ